MMKKEDISNIIKMRQEVLEKRRKIQHNLIQNMYEKQKISPRTFQLKNRELEKWVDIEKENIKKTKKELKKSWLATADTIQRTQRDIAFMMKMSSDKTQPSLEPMAQELEETVVEFHFLGKQELTNQMVSLQQVKLGYLNQPSIRITQETSKKE